jgi:hypothetical protein
MSQDLELDDKHALTNAKRQARHRIDDALAECRLVRACHGAHFGEGPVLAILAMLVRKRALRVAPGGCAPPIPCVARHGSGRPGRDGKAGPPIELESWVLVPAIVMRQREPAYVPTGAFW